MAVQEPANKSGKRTTLNLSVEEHGLVKAAAARRATSDTAAIRRAIRVMDILDKQLEAGNELIIVAPDGITTKLVFV
jgi:hypothetical protein